MNNTPTTQAVQQYGNDSQYLTPPSLPQQLNGVVPLDTLPASWWNWLWNQLTTQEINTQSDLASLYEELSNLIIRGGGTPSSASTTQVRDAVINLIQTPATSSTVGGVKSSSANGKVSIDSTGVMTANGLGDVSGLVTVDKSTVVAAINELYNKWSATEAKVGDTTDLATTIKSTVVAAINELKSRIDTNESKIGDLTQLDSDISDTDLVSAVNNASEKTGLLSQLTTTVKSSIVAAINEIKADVSGLSALPIGTIIPGLWPCTFSATDEYTERSGYKWSYDDTNLLAPALCTTDDMQWDNLPADFLPCCGVWVPTQDYPILATYIRTINSNWIHTAYLATDTSSTKEFMWIPDLRQTYLGASFQYNTNYADYKFRPYPVAQGLNSNVYPVDSAQANTKTLIQRDPFGLLKDISQRDFLNMGYFYGDRIQYISGYAALLMPDISGDPVVFPPSYLYANSGRYGTTSWRSGALLFESVSPNKSLAYYAGSSFNLSGQNGVRLAFDSALIVRSSPNAEQNPQNLTRPFTLAVPFVIKAK